MGRTYKIRNRNKMNLSKKKYVKCRICNQNKISRFHHTMCDSCWRDNNYYLKEK